ncbi:MAG: hypothetical protein ABID40_03105 [Candidatus Bipolaricaulota bacterium]
MGRNSYSSSLPPGAAARRRAPPLQPLGRRGMATIGKRIGRVIGEFALGVGFGAGFAAALWLLNVGC